MHGVHRIRDAMALRRLVFDKLLSKRQLILVPSRLSASSLLTTESSAQHTVLSPTENAVDVENPAHDCVRDIDPTTSVPAMSACALVLSFVKL